MRYGSVTLGNIVGGFLFTGLALYATQREPTAKVVVDIAYPVERATAD